MITPSKCWNCGREEVKILYEYGPDHYRARVNPGTNCLVECTYCPKHPETHPPYGWGPYGNGPAWEATLDDKKTL